MWEWGITTGLLLSGLLFLLGLADFGRHVERIGKKAVNWLIVGIVFSGVAAFSFSHAWLFTLAALLTWYIAYGRLRKSTTFNAAGKAGIRLLVASTVVAAAGWLSVRLLPDGEIVLFVALELYLLLLVAGWARVRASFPARR
jgi:hypothetical protein